MPERRKSPEEYAEEIKARRNDDDVDDDEDADSAPERNRDPGPDTSQDQSGFEPFTRADRREANRAFNLLINNGYVTVGPYELGADIEGRKVVTLSAYLPSSLDEHPIESEAEDDDSDPDPDPDTSGTDPGGVEPLPDVSDSDSR